MDSIIYTITTVVMISSIYLGATIFTIFILIGIFYYENRPFQNVQKILVENNYIIFSYDWSPRKILENKIINILSMIRLSKGLKKTYFGKIHAKNLKNKSFLMVEEKTENYPYNKIVFELRNPKNQFPSFKMSRNVWEPLPKGLKFIDSTINDYYSLSTNNSDPLLTKFSNFELKRYIRSMALQVFQIEHDQRLHIITLMADKQLVKPTIVAEFLLVLDEELEDYKEPNNDDTHAKLHKELITHDISLPHSLKIFNSLSLVNIKELKIKCAICWGRIDYTTETLLFECCTGYTHIKHGLDWLQNNKDECPKCGQKHPFTLQLPTISLK